MESDSTGLSAAQIIRAKIVADSLGVVANNPAEIKQVHEKYVEKN